MKTKRKNEWYRRPKEEIIVEHLFSDGDVTMSIILGVQGETPWRINPYTEKISKLLKYAEKLGLNLLDVKQGLNPIQGIKTKRVQEEERLEEEFVKAVFYECGAQDYL